MESDLFELKRRRPKRRPNKMYCSNCGGHGHPFKHCHEPITSYGVVALRLRGDLDPEEFERSLGKASHRGVKMESEAELKMFCLLQHQVDFAMIRRKHTLGFMEFVRGHYRVDNVDGIIFLFQQMTPDEIDKVAELGFNELWRDLWGDTEKSGHEHEYELSKKKFEQLVEDEELLNLNFYVSNVTPGYSVPEWGFPKGRRNYREGDLNCARREFEEETNLMPEQYRILETIEPYEEEFIGTNGIRYRHVYYLAVVLEPKELTVENTHQQNEIGDIGWFTYEQAMQLIRPYHTERKRLLTEIYVRTENAMISVMK